MILRSGRMIVALAATLTMLASCSSDRNREDSQPAAGAPVETPARTSPSASSSASTEPRPPAPSRSPAAPTSPADACVAPEGAALEDQDPDDHQVPWRRNGARKVVISFETKDLPADWVAELQKGVAAWNRSACLDTGLVEQCLSGTNCVTVSVEGGDEDGNFDAEEAGGFTTGGHIDLSSSLTGGERTNVTVHEMGHAVGLAHRLTERVLMNGDTYDDVYAPDALDFQNLLVIYGSQD